MQEAKSEKIAAALAIVHQAMARIEALSDATSADGAGALRAVAERLYSDRRKRDEHFPPGLFGEPAWDLLLALFIARGDGREMTLAMGYKAACVEAGPGRELIAKMESEGLVATGGDSLLLTDDAHERLSDYLARIL
jgi:hypothetical protein